MGTFVSFSSIAPCRELETRVIETAVGLLFGKVSENEMEELSFFMKERFQQCHCLALFISESDRKEKADEEERRPFVELCRRLNLDPEMREVIITTSSLLYSRSYKVRPAKVMSW